MSTTGQIYSRLIDGIRDFFHESKQTKAIIGLSGGIDSALTAAICVDALGSMNVKGVSMPSKFSSKESISDAEDLAKNLKISFVIIPIEDMVQSAVRTLLPFFVGYADPSKNFTNQNIQARMRMIVLMALSNEHGGLVINTCNLTEDYLGYATMYGDSSGAVAPLGKVGKMMVYDLACYRNEQSFVIPESSITKAPSAELCPGQTDEGSLGAPYSVLDPLTVELDNLMRNENNKAYEKEIDELYGAYGEELVKKVMDLMRKNKYKLLQAPPSINLDI